MTTVKQLIEYLDTLDPNLEVGICYDGGCGRSEFELPAVCEEPMFANVYVEGGKLWFSAD